MDEMLPGAYIVQLRTVTDSTQETCELPRGPTGIGPLPLRYKRALNPRPARYSTPLLGLAATQLPRSRQRVRPSSPDKLQRRTGPLRASTGVAFTEWRGLHSLGLRSIPSNDHLHGKRTTRELVSYIRLARPVSCNSIRNHCNCDTSLLISCGIRCWRKKVLTSRAGSNWSRASTHSSRHE